MELQAIFNNKVLIAALVAWGLAQLLKVPIEYIRSRQWNWALLLQVGGMPSSHSALVSAIAHGIGLYSGFDSPVFALSVGIAVIVIYDATGIRRQAGRHAALINAIVKDLASGHLPESEKQVQLREVLGHTPLEAITGMIFGILIAHVFWVIWIP